MKVVGGLRGDEVDVEAGWVAVNGERLANSATLARDSVGRPLTHVVWGKRRVGAGRGLAIWFEQPAKLGFPILRSDSFASDSRSCRAGADVVTVMASGAHSTEQGLRVHYLTNLGGLVALAGLDMEPPDFLLGALLSIASETVAIRSGTARGDRGNGTGEA